MQILGHFIEENLGIGRFWYLWGGSWNPSPWGTEGQCVGFFTSVRLPGARLGQLRPQAATSLSKGVSPPSVLAGGRAPAQVRVLAKSHEKQPIQTDTLTGAPFPPLHVPPQPAWLFWLLQQAMVGSNVLLSITASPGLPWGLRRWRIHWQCRRPGYSPWVGKIPRRRTWQPTPVLSLGKSHGQRSLADYSPWGRKGSDTTERLTLSQHHRGH